MNEIDYLSSILDKIIDDNLDSFKENNSFQVRLYTRKFLNIS